MLIPLIWLALQASPAVDPSQVLQHELEDLKRRVRDENHLLNQQISLPALNVWDPSGQWRLPLEREQPSRTLLRVLHLWADYCTPCLTELPQFKSIVERAGRSFGKEDLQFIFVSETSEAAAMRAFMKQHGDKLPVGVKYGDSGFALRDLLASQLPPYLLSGARHDRGMGGRGLPLPITVVLDSSDVVRLAFVGSMEGRFGDLMTGILQLHELLKSRPLYPEPVRGRSVAGRPGRSAQ